MKFVDLIQCITAGESVVVYERSAFQQSAPASFWGNVSGCYEDLHEHFDRTVSLQKYKGEICVILEDAHGG